ncbi:precorrin-6y C5,15-methyltransferase (decarboxylating) subunit CbiE [Desulfomicrobium sp. ZS1]|uniref:precorrin-6y C5,15-methyltransferase (decarboxylating) subunit CbiE n=1 Tax=Desulfomicrobium sp. ZS1 TaxID=2952228 RepID=UPI0020B37D3D|nr:precorrin-6y C5,15-methyltransferase (decarboxylating) subunit CbiE [Desulfomicrobium sp. ZS1]UTF48656.1 precorrin-6y C5,15-methyltransferase (decarboxylating) subunit CbiE [Desulfomicrobium sp. ZS1]
MIHVLGLGLSPAHRSPGMLDLIRSADLVAGGRRLLDELEIEESRRLPLGSMDEFAARIQSRAEDGVVCVLADGDPLLYGIGASLLRFFAPRELTFHPNVSALQTACARFGLPWHECRALSLHGRDDQAPLFAALTHGSLAALYTDNRHSPDAIARLLLERGVTGWRMHVAEALGGPEEQLTTIDLAEAAQRSWHTLNIILLERITPPTLTLELGLDENALAHAGALMTKQPVRAFALSLLRLPPDATLWDLGAGSGAVSLEAARLLRRGRVVAVERQAERVRHIKENVGRTGAWLTEVVQASLEEFLEDGNYRTYGTHGTYNKTDKAQVDRAACPEHTSHKPHTSHSSPPTHIFLGGGASDPVLSRCAALLAPGGRLVVAAVLLSTLETARAVFSRLGWPLIVHQLMHHASSPLGGDMRLVPSNPVFLLETQKPSSDT